MKRLNDRVAIVTGAGQGIGRGIALAFASEGANVMVVDIREDNCERVSEELRLRGAEAIPVICDVSNRIEVDACIARAKETFGRIDILVNCAISAIATVPLAEITQEEMSVGWSSGLLGTLNCMQACYPAMRGHDAKIINFGSIAGVEGWANTGGYGPVKEAIRSLTKVAAREWGSDGIRVNAICPNADSPGRIEARRLNPELFATLSIENTLCGRVGDPELDIGAAATFLASDDSRYITGHTLMVDGGSCAW